MAKKKFIGLSMLLLVLLLGLCTSSYAYTGSEIADFMLQAVNDPAAPNNNATGNSKNFFTGLFSSNWWAEHNSEIDTYKNVIVIYKYAWPGENQVRIISTNETLNLLINDGYVNFQTIPTSYKVDKTITNYNNWENTNLTLNESYSLSNNTYWRSPSDNSVWIAFVINADTIINNNDYYYYGKNIIKITPEIYFDFPQVRLEKTFYTSGDFYAVGISSNVPITDINYRNESGELWHGVRRIYELSSGEYLLYQMWLYRENATYDFKNWQAIAYYDGEIIGQTNYNERLRFRPDLAPPSSGDTSGDSPGNIDLTETNQKIDEVNQHLDNIENTLNNVTGQTSGEEAETFWENVYNNLFTITSGEAQEILNNVIENTNLGEIGTLSGELATLNLLTGEPSDFIISWGNVLIPNLKDNTPTTLIPSGEINFSKQFATIGTESHDFSNPTFTLVIETVRVILGYTVVLLLMANVWETLMRALGVGVDMYEANEEEKARMEYQETTEYVDYVTPNGARTFKNTIWKNPKNKTKGIIHWGEQK